MAIMVDALIKWPTSDPYLARVFTDGSCHLFAQTREELPELHRIAQAIGMRRAWFQDRPYTKGKPGNLPHYDLTKARREAALRAGAKEGTRRDLVVALRLFRDGAKL